MKVRKDMNAQATWTRSEGRGDSRMKRITVLLLGLTYALLTTYPGHTSDSGAPVHIILSMPAATRPAPASSTDGLSDTAEASVAAALGSEVIVRVRDEGGAERVGAKVYHSGTYVGLTDEAGTISLEDVRMGDELAALYQVYEHSTAKGHHTLDGSGNWAWRVYQTSVRIDDEGAAQLFQVRDLGDIQELTVRRDQPLIGFHIVACVEWDADSAYMADLGQGLQNASNLLYDVTDGQFFWEVIEVFDDRADLRSCDVRILASNQQWPWGHIGGITMGQSKYIVLGRHFNGDGSDNGDWASEDGFRPLVHEFGHYGLGLWDEYPRAQGGGSAPHTYPVSGDTCSSIMNNPYSATGLCSRADANYEQGLQTEHAARTKGELTWETVLRRFADTANLTRWMLQSPVERGGVLPGPEAIPASGWMQMHITDYHTGVCPAFKIQAIYEDSGEPMGEAEVWVDASSPSRSSLRQGKADESGRIVVYGAHAGDRIRVTKGTSSAAITVDCSESRVWEQTATAESVQ